MLLLGALALSVPAVTLASGGGSAGDQQYTDPFAGTPPPSKSKPKTTVTTPPPTTPTAPAPASAPTPAPATTPASATATPVASTSSDPTTPTATIATSTAGTLAHTGYDSWLAAALGFALVGGGLGLRARLRRT
jgi:uncharacterized protein HemX